MPTRIPIYRDDIFARLDKDKAEIIDKITILNNNVVFLIKSFDKVMKQSKKKEK